MELIRHSIILATRMYKHFNDRRMDLFIYHVFFLSFFRFVKGLNNVRKLRATPQLSTWTFSKGIWHWDQETFLVCAMFSDFMMMTNLNSVYYFIAFFNILQEYSCRVCLKRHESCSHLSWSRVKTQQCRVHNSKAIFIFSWAAPPTMKAFISCLSAMLH